MGRSSLLFRKELIHVGRHVKDDKEIVVTDDLVDHWVSTFREMRDDGLSVPVPVEHTTDPEKNRGHVVEMERGVNSQGLVALYGYIEFIDEDAARLAKSAKVSIYMPPEFSSGKGKTYDKPITHVALTDYPVVAPMDEWEPIAASFSKETVMKLTQAVKAALGKLKFEYDEEKDDEESLAQALGKAVAKLAEDEEKREEEAAKAANDDEGKEDKSASDDEKKEMSISMAHVEMLKENREAKLDRLVEKGAITPAVKKRLMEKFGSEKTLRLSLSSERYDDGFSDVIESLRDNDPVVLGSQTGGQSGRTAVALSREHMDPAKNPLIADANRRAGVK